MAENLKNITFNNLDFKYSDKYLLNDKLYLYVSRSNMWYVIDINNNEIIIKKSNDTNFIFTKMIYHDGYFYCMAKSHIYKTSIEDLQWVKYKKLDIDYNDDFDNEYILFSTTNDITGVTTIYILKADVHSKNPSGMYILDCPSFEEINYISHPNEESFYCYCCLNGVDECRSFIDGESFKDYYSELINDKIIVIGNKFNCIFDIKTLTFQKLKVSSVWDYSIFFVLSINDQFYYNCEDDKICLVKFCENCYIAPHKDNKIYIGKCNAKNSFTYYDNKTNNIITVNENRRHELVINKFKFPL